MLRKVGTIMAVLVLVAACGDSSDATAADVSVSHARIGLPAGADAALYFTLENSGGTDAILVGVDVDITEMAALHEVQVNDGLSKMVAMPDGVTVPAGGVLVFEPGGMHAMLMAVAELHEEMSVEVVFLFETLDPVVADAEVVSLASLS